MVILIGGATHTGKTVLAQRLLERYHCPYLSIDHLKMGLIRSGQTSISLEEDEALTTYLWPIVREMIKTVIENKQHLIVEGCYIPFDFQKDFSAEELQQMRHRWLVMSEEYITSQFQAIKDHAHVVEQRLDDTGLSVQQLILENKKTLKLCQEYQLDTCMIEKTYDIDITIL